MIQLSTSTVLVNDEVVAIVPNSLKFVGGKGERRVRTASVGDGVTEQILSQDIETAVGKVMFDLHTTKINVDLYEDWQEKGNGNTVGIAGRTDEGDFTKTFTQAVMTNDPEAEIATEGNIAVEFSSNRSI